MTTSLKPAANALSRHKREQPKDPDDWYVEEAFCVHVLLDVLEELGLLSPGRPGTVLDPHAGMGTIPGVCCARGLCDVTGSDLRDRGFPGVTGGVDFHGLPAYAAQSHNWVITNPPYFGGAGPLATLERAAAVARDGIALLVNMPFLAGQSRHVVFARPAPGWAVSDVVILSMRPSMPPGAALVAGAVKQRGGKEDFCWVVLRPRDRVDGAARIHWRMPRPEHTPPGRGLKRSGTP
ncbi:hypothetical protein [Azospirillum halopraeferens]|uniref:hypothetical protein n=1 Tax=Azospirillum halopraeferens TaxID=34010 RepID=UPI00041B5AC3|nr:hypothetical protein [Azospirillum halopraeferens]